MKLTVSGNGQKADISLSGMGKGQVIFDLMMPTKFLKK